MKTTDEWMAETMQPIIDRIAGDHPLNLLHPSLGLAFTAEFSPRHPAEESAITAVQASWDAAIASTSAADVFYGRSQDGFQLSEDEE